MSVNSDLYADTLSINTLLWQQCSWTAEYLQKPHDSNILTAYLHLATQLYFKWFLVHIACKL